MNRHLRWVSVGIGLLLVAALLAGCGSITFGSSGGLFGQGHISRQTVGPANSNLDSDDFRVGAGKTIVVGYTANVKGGDLRIYVRQAWLGGDRLYSIKVDRSGSDQVRVPVPRAGNHKISVSLWGFDGDFDVSWKVE